MKISFILVNSKTPENIGAAARAMKTMGFSDLRLVNPGDHLSDPARWLAHKAEDILESARIFQSIHTAVRDLDFIIGTSSKKRPSKNENIPSSKLAKLIEAKGFTIHSTGIMFGTEDRGLSNDQLAVCDILSHIPMQQAQPSLNLAQSVMVYAYELSQLVRVDPGQSAPLPKEAAYHKLKREIADILDELGLEKHRPIHNRIIERLALLTEKDTGLIQSVVSKIKQKGLA